MVPEVNIFFDGIARGIYIFNAFVVGILLITRLFGLSKKPGSTITNLNGIIFLINALSVLLLSIGLHVEGSELLLYISRGLNIITGMLIVVFGVMLYTGSNKISTGWLLAAVVPYTALLAISCVTPISNPAILLISGGMYIIFNVILGVLLFNRDKELQLYYTDIEHRRVRWYIYAIMATIVIFVFTTYANSIGMLWADFIYYMSLTAIQLYIGINMIFQQEVSQQVLNTIETTIRVAEGESVPVIDDALIDSGGNANRKESDDAAVHSALGEKLIRAMEHDLVFTDPNLTVEKTALFINSNVTYIYNVLRTEFHTTFFEFVNQYRVERSKEMLNNKFLRVTDVAFECGFNSPQSFNRTFKRMTGMSPTEYRECN